MRLLLDTHCWLWLQTAPERFSPETMARLVAEDTELLLSAASAWEIAIKCALGKLTLPLPPDKYVSTRMATSGVTGLAIEVSHATRVAELPHYHRDPFDRLLIAQAQKEGLTILTVDPMFEPYGVPILSP